MQLSSFASHIDLCVAIVANVSPNWTKTVASRVVSSMLNLLERALATAVTDAVNWQEFIVSLLVNCLKNMLVYCMKKARYLLPVFPFARTPQFHPRIMTKQKKPSLEGFQTVEKVQKSLGFFCVLWYNILG